MATQTLFTLPQALRGPVNDLKTPTYTVPTGATTVIISTVIAPSDLQDTTKSMTLLMECSSDGGQTFQVQDGFTWQGGTDKNGNPQTHSPDITFPVANMTGESCRLSVTIPIAITIGATVQVS